MRSNKLEERITIFSDPLVMLSQYIIVSISGDEMKASISVNIPERFQNMVSVPLLYRILKNSKVQAGISQDRINTLFSKLNSERTIQNFPVASGQTEIFGHDGQMKLSSLFKNKIIFDKKSKNNAFFVNDEGILSYVKYSRDAWMVKETIKLENAISLSVHNNNIIVGAFLDSTKGKRAGAAYILKLIEGK